METQRVADEFNKRKKKRKEQRWEAGANNEVVARSKIKKAADVVERWENEEKGDSGWTRTGQCRRGGGRRWLVLSP